MVLSLGHIHRSELPPTTASVIAGCRGDAGTRGASSGTTVALPTNAKNHFAPLPALSGGSDADEGNLVLSARLQGKKKK